MRRLVFPLALLATVLALAGCGSHKRTIPTARAESMLSQLDTVGDRFDNQACAKARAKVSSLESQARALPGTVDRKVKRNLIAGLARLDRLVARDCQKRPNTTTTTTTTPAPTPTAPTPTTPTPAPTTPTTTPTTPTTTPTTPTHTTTTPTTPTPTSPSGGVTVPGTTTAGGGRASPGSSGKGQGGNEQGDGGSGQ
jgi:hypothetical protein